MEPEEKLLRAMVIEREHYCMLNDNFFKRVHVFMAAGEAALLLLTVKTVTDVWRDFDPKAAFVLLGAFALAGMFLAVVWFALGTRQVEALELSRRFLRALEAEALRLGVPVGIHTCDRWVMAPQEGDTDFQRRGIVFRRMNDWNSISFSDAQPGDRPFPEAGCHWWNRLGRFRSWRMRGKVSHLETLLSWGFYGLWVATALVCIAVLWNARGVQYVAVGYLLTLLGSLPFSGYVLLARPKWLCVVLLVLAVLFCAFGMGLALWPSVRILRGLVANVG